ncbi:MAG: prepilin-type N-terminal cleavage/methylation domain-containing protein [Hydrogenovibrio sp.]|uniref:type II secretion system protein n=1 Tax=Hydrogenovibrio sp. TaxID=2065821 RepID=UPI00286FCABA|nr:prepilin-type N-terminal cleavage/methylation domain-containing protein [Hydrogenovibrio sp.]MDR9498565.1 prepilin-type N-terminal cleavage/methylation domain-containing protein [Hydrogenovibrio sp.]
MFSRDNPPCSNGFTLVEIAITLVIIGLLLSGTLKAQELIRSSQINQTVQDFQNFQAAYYSYQDRLGNIPGVSATPGRLYIAHTNHSAHNQDGRFFFDLADQGFISQSQPMPPEALADFYTAGFGSTQNIQTHETLTIEDANQLCARGLKEPAFARALDTKLDDGNPDSGDVQANEAYDSQALSLVCMRLD